MSEINIVLKARDFSKRAHEGQLRKLSSTPYFTHPCNVASILQNEGLSDEVIAAGYLHDVIEDTCFTIEDIRQEFGDKIAFIVLGNTENKELSWEDRKRHTIESTKKASMEIKALIGADKLDNLRSIIKGYNLHGETIWDSFKRGKKEQYWYYSEVVKSLFENIEENEIPSFFYELKELTDTFYKMIVR